MQPDKQARWTEADIPKCVPGYAWQKLMDETSPQDEAVGALCEIAQACTGFHSRYEVARTLARSPLFESKREGGPIRTIASHYFRVDGKGGVEIVLSAVAKELGKGHRVIAIADGECQTSDIPGFSLEPLVGSIGRLRAFAQVLRENEVDVLLLHFWNDCELVWVVALCRILGVRTVLNTHGVFSFYLGVTDGSSESWSDGRMFTLVPQIARLCDAVVCETPVNARFFSKFNQSSYAIPNIVNTEVSESIAIKSENESCNSLLWVGRFDELKHQDEAVRIFAKVAAKRADARMTFVGAGDSREYEAELSELAKRLGVDDRIDFAGWQEDTRPYYENAGVFLCTSETEGFCMSIAEALSYGIPVVSYDMPYLSFASCKGVSWVAQHDIDAAADEVCRIMSSKDLRGEMGKAGRGFITNNVAKASHTGWIRLIEELSKQNSGADTESSDDASKDHSNPDSDMERLMWDTLFDHYNVGVDRTHALYDLKMGELSDAEEALRQERAARLQAETELEGCRKGFEESYSYKLGRALLTPARAVRRTLNR